MIVEDSPVDPRLAAHMSLSAHHKIFTTTNPPWKGRQRFHKDHLELDVMFSMRAYEEIGFTEQLQEQSAIFRHKRVIDSSATNNRNRQAAKAPPPLELKVCPTLVNRQKKIWEEIKKAQEEVRRQELELLAKFGCVNEHEDHHDKGKPMDMKAPGGPFNSTVMKTTMLMRRRKPHRHLYPTVEEVSKEDETLQSTIITYDANDTTPVSNSLSKPYSRIPSGIAPLKSTFRPTDVII